MQMLHGGMLIAAAAGLLAGGAMRVDPYAPGDRPRGPQQIYSMPVEYGVHEAYGYTEADFRVGPTPDYVVGTDWLPGGRYDRPAPAASFIDEGLEAIRARLYAKYEIPAYEPPPAPPPPTPLQAEAAADSASEHVEIVLANHQTGGQVNDATHWSDPDAQVSEPAS